MSKKCLSPFAIAFIASIGGFLFGYDLSLIGAANLYLQEQFHLSDQAMGFATGSAALGCMFGPFLGAWLCDRIGREKTMIASSILLGIGAIATALAPNIHIFNLFRIIGGIGVGLCSIASPLYIAEIAPANKRGRLGFMYQLAIVLGSIIAPLVAWALVSFLPGEYAWRWMFFSQMVFVVLFVAFVFLLPSSPRWLAEQLRFDEARAVLIAMDGEAHADRELSEIKLSLQQKDGRFSELLKPAMLRLIVIGLLLAFFNNWTGWSVIAGYIPMLFELAGVHSRNLAILEFSFIYLFMGLLTLGSMSLVDRIGRKPLWVFSSILMALITILTGWVFHLHIQGFLVLLVLALCTVPHGLALGPLPWLMMSEIFPTHLRAKAVAITTTFLWLLIYLGAQLFPMIVGASEKYMGSPAGAFWLFASICVLSTLFGWKLLPETRGRTLEEIGQSSKG